MSGFNVSSPDSNILAEIQGLLPDDFQLGSLHERFSHSANEVFSAVLKSAQVVVKPFKGEFHKDKADHEAFMFDVVKSCGIPTLSPTTLCLGRVANYLLTRYEPDITPLDQAGLNERPKNEISDIAYGVGQVLGDLHGNGIVHGDFQIKNLFLGPDS